MEPLGGLVDGFDDPAVDMTVEEFRLRIRGRPSERRLRRTPLELDFQVRGGALVPTPGPAFLVQIGVATDREEPRLRVRASLERIPGSMGAEKRLLGQVLGRIPVPTRQSEPVAVDRFEPGQCFLREALGRDRPLLGARIRSRLPGTTRSDVPVRRPGEHRPRHPDLPPDGLATHGISRVRSPVSSGRTGAQLRSTRRSPCPPHVRSKQIRDPGGSAAGRFRVPVGEASAGASSWLPAVSLLFPGVTCGWPETPSREPGPPWTRNALGSTGMLAFGEGMSPFPGIGNLYLLATF